MQVATTEDERDTYLTTLIAIAESPSFENRLSKEVAWARGLFSTAKTARERVFFVLQGETAERIEFASSFYPLESDGVSWRALRCATSTTDVPTGMPWEEFSGMLELLDNPTARQSASNPLVGGLLDFRSELRTSGAIALYCAARHLQSAGASKMGVTSWQPEEDFHLDSAPQEHWRAIVKALGRLFMTRPPQWVSAARDRRVGVIPSAAERLTGERLAAAAAQAAAATQAAAVSPSPEVTPAAAQAVGAQSAAGAPAAEAAPAAAEDTAAAAAPPARARSLQQRPPRN